MALEMESLSWTDINRLVAVKNGTRDVLIEKQSRSTGILRATFQVTGDIYTAYVGGVKIFDVQDRRLKMGMAGIQVDGSKVQFDNFKVTALK